MPLDFTRAIRTNAGHTVKILCTDRRDKNYPIVGLIKMADGSERVEQWTTEGKSGHLNYDFNLENVPIIKEGWINIYPRQIGMLEKIVGQCSTSIYSTREEALEAANKKLVTTMKIHWKE